MTERLAPAALAQAIETPQGQALQWRLKRNCSASPRACMVLLGSSCVVNAGIGFAFCVAGYPVIGVFGAIEMCALAAALVIYARHALDHDTLTLEPAHLRVEQQRGARVTQASLQRAWVRVSPPSRPNGPFELSERGQRLVIGDQVRPSIRAQVARELRQALAAGGRP